MTSTGRKRLWRALAAVALLSGALLGALLLLDPMVRHWTRKVCEDALLVRVDIRDAGLSLNRGMARFEGVSIHNPPGYDESLAIRFTRLDGFVEVPSLFGREIVIHDLVLVDPVLTVESARGTFNWSALIANLRATSPGDPTKPKGSETTFRIDRLRIVGAVIWFRSPLLPKGRVPVALPDLEVRNVGSAPGTATTLRIVIEVILQLLGQKAIDESEKTLPPELRDSFQKAVKKSRRPPGR